MGCSGCNFGMQGRIHPHHKIPGKRFVRLSSRFFTTFKIKIG
jgi:hypothetical protein